MSRGGPKVQVSVWMCGTCGAQAGHTYLNRAKTPKLERSRYCSDCRVHTTQATKAEKSGSLGLARNK